MKPAPPGDQGWPRRLGRAVTRPIPSRPRRQGRGPTLTASSSRPSSKLLFRAEAGAMAQWRMSPSVRPLISGFGRCGSARIDCRVLRSSRAENTLLFLARSSRASAKARATSPTETEVSPPSRPSKTISGTGRSAAMRRSPARQCKDCKVPGGDHRHSQFPRRIGLVMSVWRSWNRARRSTPGSRFHSGVESFSVRPSCVLSGSSLLQFAREARVLDLIRCCVRISS